MERIPIKLINYNIDGGSTDIYVGNTHVISIYHSGNFRVWRVPTSGTIIYEDTWFPADFSGEIKFELTRYRWDHDSVGLSIYENGIDQGEMIIFYKNGTFKYLGGLNDIYGESNPKYSGRWK